MEKDLSIRPAFYDDEEGVVEIMNSAIKEETNAYLDQMDWIAGSKWFKELQTNAFALIVCELNNIIVGWASLSHYRGGRPALLSTKEITFYVHPEHRRIGVASAMIEHLEQYAMDNEIKHLSALLLDDNVASRNLLERHGYFVFGMFENVAEFPSSIKGHLYMGKHL